MNKENLFQNLKILVLALILAAGVPYALAWTGPTAPPPGSNTPAPVNVGTTNQVKTGGLGVAGFVADSVTVGSTVNASAITSPKFCIGTACITEWPTGGGGGGGSTGQLYGSVNPLRAPVLQHTETGSSRTFTFCNAIPAGRRIDSGNYFATVTCIYCDTGYSAVPPNSGDWPNTGMPTVGVASCIKD